MRVHTNHKVPLVKDTNESTKIGGYKAEDLLKSPVKEPHPKETESRHYTNNFSVKTMIAVGTVIAGLGVVFTLLNLIYIGLILAGIGAITVALSVFIPVK